MEKIKIFIKKRWKLLLFLVIILLLIGGFTAKSRADNKIELTFQNPTYSTITKTLDVSGHIDAKEKVRLRFIAGGKTTYIGAKEGEWVKKWQTIASIDGKTLGKQIEQDLNNYMKERWDWEETKDSSENRAIETSEQRSIDKEQWDLTNTVLDVEIRDIAIKNTSIYSPIGGILTKSPAQVAGMQLLASDYFEVINPDTLVFRAAVDESDIALVMLGQKAKLILDSFSDEIIKTTVEYVSYTSSETSSGTSFVVELPLESLVGTSPLRIGMNGDINIILDTKENILTIPLISTRTRDSRTYVDVKTGENEFEEREITIGLESEENIEVISGLSESDKVLIPK